MRDIGEMMKEWNKKRVETNKEIKDMLRFIANTFRDHAKTCPTMVDDIERCYKAVIGDKYDNEPLTFEEDDGIIENDKLSYILTTIEKQAHISQNTKPDETKA